jgi:hypothetical protein
MHSIQRLFGFLSMLLVLFLLVGCGSTPSPGGISTTTPTRAPSVSPGIPTPTARADSVTLHTDRLLYQASETISVTVNNQSHQTISFPDHLTNCTVILLQRQKAQPQTSDAGQAGINPCLLKIATRIHTLPAGQHLVVQLVPTKSGWPTGFYFATLSYHTASTAGSPTTISSAAFAVNPLGAQP